MNRLWQNVRSNRIVVLFSLAIFLSFNAIAGPDGKALFKTNCAACHSISEKTLIGPGLQGVLGRIPGGNWKYDWVHNPTKMIASGDAYAVAKYVEFGKNNMTAYPALTNEEIDAILTYADAGAPVPAGQVAPTDQAVVVKEQTNPVFLIIIILILLIVLIAVLRYTKINLRNAANEKEGLPEQPAMPFLQASRHWMIHHKTKMLVMGLLLFGVLTVKGWYALKGIGVYAEEIHPNEWVGYHPSQPIKYSHKIHAGDNGIQCQYCHSGVEKSKTAGIPSAKVCMNCHMVIDQNQAGTEESKTEIAKIYAATGWNPEMRAYTRAEQPIVWNQVHALPDHVYFSHQQHVVVGQVQCEQCHGDVKKMATVEQQRPLTMGWCVNCHRETTVKMEGNDYYTSLHEKMKEKYKGQPITVAMAGGIECARCHY